METDGGGRGAVPQWAGTLSFLYVDTAAASGQGPDPGSAEVEAIARSAVAAHRGWFADAAEGPHPTVAVFRRSLAALRAAVDLQEALSEHRPEPSAGRRIAVLTGDVDQRADGTYLGQTLDRAARLLSAGHPDQVLTTAATWSLAIEDDDDSLHAVDLGEHRLRGSVRPVRIMQVHRAGATSTFPALRGVQRTAVRLPSIPTALYGRAGSVEQLDGLLEERRIVCVVGAGGVGKTRLAIESARRRAERFDQVCWVDLGAASDAHQVLTTVASSVGVVGSAASSPDGLLDALSDRRDLLVLDNCEQVLEAVRSLVSRLVDETEVVVLVTSREPIGVYGETIVRVESLELPVEDSADPVAAVMSADSSRMFLDRARLVRPGFALDEATASCIITICRRLDGLPLALELAAARLASATAQQIADGLGDRLQLLTGSASGRLSRQRTLEASIAWSYELLDEGERELLGRLSVFLGPFSHDAAVEVGRGKGCTSPELTRRLEGLARRSMLVAGVGPDGSVWYRFLETIRAFALERLIESGAAGEARRAHLGSMVDFARLAGGEFEGRDPLVWVERCRRSLPDIRAAIDHALEIGDEAAATAAVGWLGWFWVWEGLATEIRPTLERARAGWADAPPQDRLAFCFADTWTAVHSMNLRIDIVEKFDEWSSAAGESGDDRHRAISELLRGSHASFLDPLGGRALVEKGLDDCEAVGDPFWSIYAQGAVALAWLMIERFDMARPLLTAMERRARSHGSPQLLGEALSRRVLADQWEARYEELEAGCRELEGAFAELTRTNVAAAARSTLVSVEATRGRGARHGGSTRAMLDSYLRAGELQHVPVILTALADVSLATGRPDDVEPMLALVWEDIEAYPLLRVRARHRRALAALALDDRPRTRSMLDQALDDTTTLGNRATGAETEVLLAVLDRREGRHRDAFEHAWAAATTAAELGAPQTQAAAVEVMARLQLDAGCPDVAARLLGAAARVRDGGGVTLRLGWQHDHDATEEVVRNALGDRWEAEYATGGSMTLEMAMALADRLRGPRMRPKVGFDSLTATELHVAELAAAGRTNPQIAADLLVGRETIKSHLSSVYRKLGISSRVQLAGVMARRTESR